MKQVLLILAVCSSFMLQGVHAEDVLTPKNGITSPVSLEDYYMKTTKLVVYNGGDDAPLPESATRSSGSDENVIEIYNEDLTLYKSINVSGLVSGAIGIFPIESQKAGDKLFYLTQTLFNDDDLIEFIVYGSNFFAVVNENGNVLFRQTTSGQIESDYHHLIETTNYIYLGIEDYAENDWAYQLYLINRSNVSGMPALTPVKTFSYPNPAKESINIAYNLQGATTGVVKIISLSGELIDQKEVNGNADSFNYQTRRLTRGAYIVSVEAQGKQLSTEKIIIR
jgi:hypothetical protein